MIATIASADRDNSNPTHCPGPAPDNQQVRNRFAASSSSRYVSEPPPQVTATASGVRPPGQQTTRIDTSGGAGGSTLPGCSSHPGGRVPARRASIDDNPPLVAGHRHHHLLPPLEQNFDAGRVEHVGAKFHVTADPGRLTGLGEAFRKKNVRSMRAVRVSVGSGVTCRSPDASPAAGSLPAAPGRFCQANMTCTSG